jgi:hypothetical protein
MTLSYNASNNDIINEVNKLKRQIDAMQISKRAGRNVTGARAVPSAETDLISGDIVGDFLYDGSDYYEMQIVDNIGTVQWIKYTVSISF